MERSFPYKRICVVGTSATGKSTLARQLAAHIQGVHIELDAFYHGPQWQTNSDDVFIRNVQERMQGACWVVDGNYSNRARQFEASDLIIWLDYPFRIVLARVLRRTLKRLMTKEELWNGNRETWRMAFSKESIIVWVFQTYWKRRKEFSSMLTPHRYPNATIIRLRHPRDAKTLLAGLTSIPTHSSSAQSFGKAE